VPNFLINCNYCGHQDKIEYAPSKYTSCVKCKDRKHLTVQDISNSIDYYAGTTPYEEKTKEIILEEPPNDDDDKNDDDYPYLIRTYD